MSELDTKQEKNVSSDSDSDFKLRIFNEKLTVILIFFSGRISDKISYGFRITETLVKD